MKLVVFGLTISSSWGNGHATLWRGLLRALARRGHDVVFFEKDVPYYAGHRDLCTLEEGELILYESWPRALPEARRQLAEADVGMVTSYCPDGAAACALVLDSNVPMRTFYDLDTPITLAHLHAGEAVPYLPAGGGPGGEGLGDFDLVLSYTGGAALEELQRVLHARRTAPLYGSVDPGVHCPVTADARYRCDLSYLGTYAADRQAALEQLFIAPARQRSDLKFIIGGAQYPAEFPWTPNIHFVRHIPPPDHPAFFCSSRITLNITRQAMAAYGYCPSGRLFEAAACGCPILSDQFAGLDEFFAPGREILVAESTDQALAALALTDGELGHIARAARQRVLAQHTADHRAQELEILLEDASRAAICADAEEV